jgi:hypothetical protein
VGLSFLGEYQSLPAGATTYIEDSGMLGKFSDQRKGALGSGIVTGAFRGKSV